MSRQPAKRALRVARRCINGLIASFNTKCTEAEDYDQVWMQTLSDCPVPVQPPFSFASLLRAALLSSSCLTVLYCVQQAQEAMMSRLSSEQLGTIYNWPESHLPHVSTLNKLTDENNLLKNKLQTGPDAEFYAAIFDTSSKEAVQYSPDVCARRWQEMEQFKESLRYQNPSAHECLHLKQQLAAQTRQLDYEKFLRSCEQQHRQALAEQSAQRSAHEAAHFSKQLAALQNTMCTLSQQNHVLLSKMQNMKQPLQSHKVHIRVGRCTAPQSLGDLCQDQMGKPELHISRCCAVL